ncbi:MAG: ASCH domain-containing protein [Phycisphaerales bacterium]|nr:ASCH domain-containing protein [Phycisphaerales bacterium]
MRRALLVSVQMEYAEQIMGGAKTVELRRRKPAVEKGDYLIVYVPAPLRQVIGVVTVERVIAGAPAALWRRVRCRCYVSLGKYRKYFSGAAVGFGIVLVRPARLELPITLEAIRSIQPNFSPQGYRYLTRPALARAISQLKRRRASAPAP